MVHGKPEKKIKAMESLTTEISEMIEDRVHLSKKDISKKRWADVFEIWKRCLEKVLYSLFLILFLQL